MFLRILYKISIIFIKLIKLTKLYLLINIEILLEVIFIREKKNIFSFIK
jgi:hypothetical protein